MTTGFVDVLKSLKCIEMYEKKVTSTVQSSTVAITNLLSPRHIIDITDTYRWYVIGGVRRRGGWPTTDGQRYTREGG